MSSTYTRFVIITSSILSIVLFISSISFIRSYEVLNLNIRKRLSSRSVQQNGNSTCSQVATSFGPHQKVISYSYFVSEATSPLFASGIETNLKEASNFYPDWIVRIYTNIIDDPMLKNLSESYKFLHVCDIRNIPRMGNMEAMVGRTWRFLVIGDPLVDIFLSRDLDSNISKRERDAVAEWENSDYPIHVMRDHPFHSASLMGGMWGINMIKLGQESSEDIQEQIIQKSFKTDAHKTYDQEVIDQVVYSKYHNLTMAHDSYFCGTFPDGIVLPFPNKREGDTFVGDTDTSDFHAGQCPEKCRPKYGWDWEYC